MTIIDSDVFVNGQLSAKSQAVPAASIADAQVAALAGIQASKQQQQYTKEAVLCDHATNAAAKRMQIHRARGATGSILEFGVTPSVAITGNATITVDLKKNGATVLSATITLDNSTVAFGFKQPGGYASTTYVAGDVFEAEITAVNVGTGTLPKGVTAYLNVREDAQ